MVSIQPPIRSTKCSWRPPWDLVVQAQWLANRAGPNHNYRETEAIGSSRAHVDGFSNLTYIITTVIISLRGSLILATYPFASIELIAKTNQDQLKS
ncbi:unnamed protein product [Leptosia nina]|uniref:Uncharacterized protein n=1 Tax=Leptosia nina TaxID=320188 RepID=A0AAV1K3P0_9NEOP